MSNNQWRSYRGFRRFNEPGPPTSKGPKGHQDGLSDLGILSIERDRFSENDRHGILVNSAHSIARGVKIQLTDSLTRVRHKTLIIIDISVVQKNYVPPRACTV